MEKWVVLGLVLLLLLLVWKTRPRPRLPRPRVDSGFYQRLEVEAGRVAREIFELALGRLEPPRDSELAVGIGRAAAELAGKLAELRGQETASEALESEWQTLVMLHSDRFPALRRMASDCDLPGLNELASAPPEQALQIVGQELDRLRHKLEAGLKQLHREPGCIWGDLELVALTLVVTGANSEEQMAAALRAGRQAKQARSEQDFRVARILAWEIAHGLPSARRMEREGLKALPTQDPDLGVALVRFHLNEVRNQPALERARALVAGEYELFWLALEIVSRTSEPEAGLGLWQVLAPLARRALDPEDQAARSRLLETASLRLGTEARQRIEARLFQHCEPV